MSIDSVEGLPEHPDGIPGYDLFPMAQEAGMEARVEYISDDATALNADGAGWIIVSPAATVRARRRARAPSCWHRVVVCARSRCPVKHSWRAKA